jgi:hypothetical protein
MEPFLRTVNFQPIIFNNCLESKDIYKKRNPFLIVKFHAYEDEVLYEITESLEIIEKQQNQTNFETEEKLPITTTPVACKQRKSTKMELFNNNYFWLSTVPLLLLMLTSF